MSTASLVGAYISPAGLPGWATQGLPSDTHVVRTPAIRRAQALLPSTIDRRAILAIDGAAGSGKTVLLGAVAASSPVPWVILSLRPGSTGRDTMAELYRVLTGGPAPRGTQTEIEGRLRSVLAGPERRLVIVDEAQNVGLSALEAMRFLYGLADANWVWILAGVGLAKSLGKHPPLHTRIARWIEAQALSAASIPTLMAAFCPPLYRDAAPDLLQRVDAVYGRCIWRHWNHFTAEAHAYTGGTTLTEPAAVDALRSVMGIYGDIPGWDDV